MLPILTINAVILCGHGGKVTLIPHQTTVLIAGAPVICEPDIIGAPIAGCAQPATAVTKPCTTVISQLPGSTSTVVSVVGRHAYVTTLKGVTDGVPPSTIAVTFPGQTTVLG